MNKKVMSLAVAGALATPAVALAQVGVSGSIHLQYFQHDPGAIAGEKKTDILETTEPNIVIRGEEKLGGNLSAYFVCESSFDVVGTAIEGFCGRNSAIGFRGGFGNIFAGNWDTPHKLAVGPHRGWFGLNNVFARATILWNNAPSNVANGALGVGATTASVAGFSRRQAQAWNYHSPNFGGFSFQAAYSGANEGTALAAASPLKPRMMSLGARFGAGPLIVTAGYEKHDDFNPSTFGAASYGGGTDTSTVLGVSYTIAGAVKLSAVYTKSDYEAGNTAAVGAIPAMATLEADGYAFWVDWRISGPHSFKFQYVLLNDPEGTPGVTIGGWSVAAAGAVQGERGGNIMTLVYAYDFSKRTQVYLAYNTSENDANTATAATLGQTATTVGGTQKAYGLGIRHSF